MVSKKPKAPSAPSPVRTVIKDAFTVLVEWAKYRAAMRTLSKQQWSIDFLCALLVKAARADVAIRVEQSGTILHISKIDAEKVLQEPDRMQNFRRYMGLEE